MSYYSDGEKKSDVLLIILLILSLITLFLIVINNSKKIQSLEEEISTLKTTQRKTNPSDDTNSIENESVTKENTIYEIEENDTNNNQVNLTKKDKEVLDYLNDVSEKASELNSTEKSKAKGIFIGIVDFLFYDGKINGISFDELSNDGKKEVLKASTNIDAKLNEKFPNYKDTISQKTKLAFNRASDIIRKGSVKLSDFSKERLGKDNYNEIIRNRDQLKIYTKDAVSIIGETTGKITTSLKDKIKSWYDGIKN